MQTGKFPTKEFEETKRLNPYWSDHTCFAETVWNRRFLSSKTIKKYFDILVDKDEYAQDEKSQVIKHLIGLSQGIAN